MENTRPKASSIELPLKSGETEKCTIKTPKIKTDRQFREDSRAITFGNSEFKAIYNQMSLSSDAITDLKVKLADATDENIQQKLESEIEKGQAHFNELSEKLSAIDAKGFDRICNRIFNIINVPNAADGTPRTFDDIDWQEVSLEEVDKGINFFRMSNGDLPKNAQS